MKVNRSKWSLIKMQWEAKLRSIAAFKGIKDYEEWAMSQSQPLFEDEISFIRGEEPLDNPFFEFTPEEFHKAHKPVGEKDKLLHEAREIRKQIDDAISNEDYEKAQLLQDVLDVVKLKYDKL